MKRLLTLLPALCFLFTALASAADAPAVTARKALNLLLAQKFDDFNHLLTPEAAALLTPAFLTKRVGGELDGFGKLGAVGEPTVVHAGTSDLVTFPTEFANTKVAVQITVSSNGSIAGLHFRPPGEKSPVAWNRPDYSNPLLFSEHEIMIGTDEWKLPGLLTMPVGKGPFPAIVLVHGPGPNDRDESLFSNRIFADIAEGFASRGIAVLRYDKRSKAYGLQMSALEYTLEDETVEDAGRALELLKKQPGVDPRRIFVLGHSLGGYALPRVIARGTKAGVRPAGAILLAANARHIEDIAIAQTDAMLKARGNITPEETRRLELMKQEAELVRHPDPAKAGPGILLGLPSRYWADLRGYEAPAEARKTGLPMLVLQGERDFQVTMADFGMWKSGLNGAPGVVFHTYPALNHLFIAGEGPGTPAEYRNPGNVAPVVIDDMTAWLLAQKH